MFQALPKTFLFSRYTQTSRYNRCRSDPAGPFFEILSLGVPLPGRSFLADEVLDPLPTKVSNLHGRFLITFFAPVYTPVTRSACNSCAFLKSPSVKGDSPPQTPSPRFPFRGSRQAPFCDLTILYPDLCREEDFSSKSTRRQPAEHEVSLALLESPPFHRSLPYLAQAIRDPFFASAAELVFLPFLTISRTTSLRLLT